MTPESRRTWQLLEAKRLRRLADQEYRQAVKPGGLMASFTVARIYRQQADELERASKDGQTNNEQTKERDLCRDRISESLSDCGWRLHS